MAWETPIYDRTSADASTALATQSNSTDELKGSADYRTWNRIEGNTQYIADTLVSAGYIRPAIDTKTDWTRNDTLYLSEIQRMCANIEIVKANFTFYLENAPSYVLGKPITVDDVNQIERMLYDMSEWANYITSTTYYKASGGVGVASGSTQQLWRAAKTVSTTN